MPSSYIGNRTPFKLGELFLALLRLPAVAGGRVESGQRSLGFNIPVQTLFMTMSGLPLFYGGLVGSGNALSVFAVLVYRMATFWQTQCLRWIRWTCFRAWRRRHTGSLLTGVLAASSPGWADGVSIMEQFGGGGAGHRVARRDRLSGFVN